MRPGLTDADAIIARPSPRPMRPASRISSSLPITIPTSTRRDACAICAVISLANNFLFATPPLLELPQAVELLHLTTDAEFAHLGSLHPAFQSRAPPAS